MCIIHITINKEVITMKKLLFIGAILVSCNANAYGPYNQQYTMNQQFGSSNWYSSPLGMGVAQAGVALVSGIVNKMSQPDPVQVQQAPPQVIYVNQNGQPTGQQPQGGYPQQQYPQSAGHPANGYSQPSAANNCHGETVYDQAGTPRYVKVCQ